MLLLHLQAKEHYDGIVVAGICRMLLEPLGFGWPEVLRDVLPKLCVLLWGFSHIWLPSSDFLTALVLVWMCNYSGNANIQNVYIW